MALSSPGTQITIIDESQYLPAAPNSIPLVVIATAQNKVNAAGTGVATATTKANAGKLYQVTSQRDLITYFGNPFFYKTTNGTSIHGYELNEYGLLAAYSVLGSTNLVYAIRADIDLAALVGKTGRPSSQPDNGSWWLDTASSVWGIFEFDATTGSFTNKKPTIITDSALISGGKPLDSVAPIGSYAVNLSADNSAAPDTFSTYFYRSANQGWVALGDPEWRKAWPTAQGTASNPTITTSGDFIFTRGTETANVTATISDGISTDAAGTVMYVAKVNSSTVNLSVGTLVTGSGIEEGTYISALGATGFSPAGSGASGYYTVSKSQLVMPTQAVFTGSIATTTLTVSTVTSGTLAIGGALSGSVTNSVYSALSNETLYHVESVGYTDYTTVVDLAPTAGAKTFSDYGISSYNARTTGAKMIVNKVNADHTNNNGTSVATSTVGGLTIGREISKTATTGSTLVDTNGLDSGKIIQQTHRMLGTVVSDAAIASGDTKFSYATATSWKQTDGTTNLDITTLADMISNGTLCLIRGDLTDAGTNTGADTTSNGLAKITGTVLATIIGIDSNNTEVTIKNGATGSFNTNIATGAVFTLFEALDAPSSITATAAHNDPTKKMYVSGTFDTDVIKAGSIISGKGIRGGTTIAGIDATKKTITLSDALQTHGSGTYYIYPSTSGGEGIYKVSVGTNLASSSDITVLAQPTVGTEVYIDTSQTGFPTAPSVSQGTVSQEILSGTYITALGTGTGGTGTYTVSQSQTLASTTITSHAKTMSLQYGIDISVTAGDTVSDIADAITALNIPHITALADTSVSQKLTLYYHRPDSATVSRYLNITGTPELLAELGLSAKEYYAPKVSYGTNANQPLWKSTDATPRPTGSVWIKTNAYGSGLDIVLGQYSTASAAFTSKKINVYTSDAEAINSLDSTGGAAIPLNSVYLQVPNDTSYTPSRLFYRSATGASVFTGTVSDPTGFVVGSVLDVVVSVPGTSTASDTYRVTMAHTGATAGDASATSADFIDAWNAATLNGVSSAIPYTKVGLDSATGAIVITHTEGGTITLDDSANKLLGTSGYTSPLSVAGFTPYNLSTNTGTVGARYGAFKTLTYTGVATTGGNGNGLTVNATTIGAVPIFTINTAGTNYNTGESVDVVLNGATITVKINNADGTTGAVTSVEHFSGDAVPEYKLTLSNWEPFLYTADDTTPVNDPTDGTPWFYSVINQVDIMVNVGGVWKGYLNTAYDSSGSPTGAANAGNNTTGPIVSASEPSTQTDGTPLVYGDLWLDSGDLENYPSLYRWQLVSGVKQWVAIDKTDQTTENGVLFADARWGTSGTVDPVNDKMPTIQSLLSSDYLDLDAPEGTAYPQGMLLFNTRRSGYNVKKFRKNYFNGIDFADQTLPTQTDAWVSASGLKSDGSPYMGRKAQRAMVVQALKSMIDTSSELRDDQTSYNLIATPGYPELQPNMISLNNDRNNTAYIIGDTPLRLKDDANDITQWAANSKGATATGEDGLVSRDTYLGVYYPSGITTDLTGADVVVPSSHMILRTIIHNDNVAYPWFAPAGMRRGIVDNATNIGYIDAASGEFKTTQNRVALRDVEYTNMINPIAFFRNVGLLNYGNKNSYDSQSALDRTNVARLICYIRDRLQIAVRPFLFEPNDARTRDQVKAVILTLMADIKTKRGIYDYLVVCDESNNTPARIDRNELWIDIAIEPVKAIEFIYIPVRVLNTGEIAKLG